MPVYPRESDNYGHDTTWEDHAHRPANPNHGTKGWNEETKQVEVYDAITETWYTTVSMLAVALYP
jgi:hypothetical protein